jgi:hypothetical protein
LPNRATTLPSEAQRHNPKLLDQVRDVTTCRLPQTNPPADSPAGGSRNFCCAGDLYIAMCDTGSLQSPWPVLPPMAHNCKRVGDPGREAFKQDRFRALE